MCLLSSTYINLNPSASSDHVRAHGLGIRTVQRSSGLDAEEHRFGGLPLLDEVGLRCSGQARPLAADEEPAQQRQCFADPWRQCQILEHGA
jgi:hypothetical protein